MYMMRFLLQSDYIMNNLISERKEYEKFQSLFLSNLNYRKIIEKSLKSIFDFKNSFKKEVFVSQVEKLKVVVILSDAIPILEELDICWTPTENELKAFHIIRNGELNELKELFDNDPTIRINVRNRQDVMLLEAVYYEKYEFVEYLIEKGADITICDDVGRNPLQMAALVNSNDDIINLLISKNCPFPNDDVKAILLNDIEAIKRMKKNKN